MSDLVWSILRLQEHCAYNGNERATENACHLSDFTVKLSKHASNPNPLHGEKYYSLGAVQTKRK